MIFQALFLLTFALLRHEKGSNQTEDATYVAKYLRFLREQPHAALGFPRYAVTAFLGNVLVYQAELGADMLEGLVISASSSSSERCLC